MKTAMQFANTAKLCASSLSSNPEHILLMRIADKAERIQLLKSCTENQRNEALAICWSAYAKVLKRVDSMEDESYGNAKRRGSTYESDLPIIRDQAFADRLLYGEPDVDVNDD